ncbi:hypothetical protein B0H13DRAFT_1856053 [Mycena leptocephala]|nr:hypothetical protein B0H13DRAFT_1856053 [Mycena leptocephala]
MSSSSYASLTGLTVLENPRQTTTMGLIFDANFFLGGKSTRSILASLRYFNANKTKFPDVGVYFVYATVAQMDPSVPVDLFAGPDFGLSREDFTLIGDIQFLYLLGEPDDVDINFLQRPYAHICGAVLNPDPETAKWSMEADQYTTAIRDVQKLAKEKGDPLPRSFFPAICTIPDSSRYTNAKKPVPFNKRYVMVAGYLTDTSSTLDNDSKIKDSFCIDVDNIAFLGTQTTPATGGTVMNSPAPSTSASTPGARNNKRWSYDTPIGNKKKKSRMSSPTPEIGTSSPAGPSSSPTPGPSNM